MMANKELARMASQLRRQSAMLGTSDLNMLAAQKLGRTGKVLKKLQT